MKKFIYWCSPLIPLGVLELALLCSRAGFNPLGFRGTLFHDPELTFVTVSVFITICAPLIYLVLFLMRRDKKLKRIFAWIPPILSVIFMGVSLFLYKDSPDLKANLLSSLETVIFFLLALAPIYLAVWLYGER